MHTTYTYIALQMYTSVCLHIVLGKAKANKANGNSDAPTIRMQFRLQSIEARTNTHTHTALFVRVYVCVWVMANECYSYLQMDSRGASSMQGIPHISLDKPRHLSPQFSAFN